MLNYQTTFCNNIAAINTKQLAAAICIRPARIHDAVRYILYDTLNKNEEMRQNGCVVNC